MQLSSDFDQASWYSLLIPRQRDLVQVAHQLYEREQQSTLVLADYGFIIFPMAKAYEGFLKKYFLELGLITEEVYRSRKFRIGRALNPDVRPEHRNGEWLYDDLERECGKGTAHQLWDAWLICRNQIFHYFPDKDNQVSLLEAGRLLEMLNQAMEEAIACRSNQKSAKQTEIGYNTP